MEFQKISSPSLRELFVKQLEHMILSGRLAVGERLRAEEIRSILEVRIALDTLAAELCKTHITDEEIGVLEEIIERLKNAPSVEEAVEAAYEFQHEFAIFSGNTLIPLIF